MSRRHKAKGAIAGLRSIQALGSLAVPGTLEKVPEEIEIKSTKNEIFASNDWKSVQKTVRDIFNDKFRFNNLGEGGLYALHQNVRNILESKTGTFFCDCYKEWVLKEMGYYAEKLRDLKGAQLLQKYEEIWSNFYRNTLNYLESVLYLVKPNGRMTIRWITLAAFRDVVLLAAADLEGAIRSTKEVSPAIEQMLLILAWVNDSYPPNKNKLRAEYLAAQVTSRFLGYLGLYENGELVVVSNEPMLAAKRRPSADVGSRRISRPFSVQPHNMDTLNQLFKNAVRQKTIKEHR